MERSKQRGLVVRQPIEKEKMRFVLHVSPVISACGSYLNLIIDNRK